MRLSSGWIAVATLPLLALMACGNCGRHDYYDFDFQKPLDYSQLIFRSSLVVVGTVQAVEVTRSGVPSRKEPDLLLDETRVDLAVENILRGDWPKPRLRFYFFTFSTQNKGGYSGPPRYRVEVGERRVFFLTTDSGEFRSVADVRGEYSIRVRSGLHRNFRRSEDPKDPHLQLWDSRRVADDISAILLEPGEGAQASAMASNLYSPATLFDRLTSRKRIVARLVALTGSHQDRQLRLQACRILSEQFAGQSGCLYALRDEPSLTSDDHRQIETWIAMRKKWDANLKHELKTQPMYAFHLNKITAVREEFLLLLSAPDPELRQLACSSLRQHFPGELEGNACRVPN